MLIFARDVMNCSSILFKHKYGIDDVLLLITWDGVDEQHTGGLLVEEKC